MVTKNKTSNTKEGKNTNAKTETFSTGEGKVLFMTVNKPLKNKQTGKINYSIRLELPENDQSIKHLKKIAEYKIDTKTNRSIMGTGKKVVSFETSFQPTVVGVDGEHLEGENIPFFDGRVDQATAKVVYTVVKYDDRSIIRLSGVRLTSLDISPDKGLLGTSGGKKTVTEILDKLKNL